jgi:hypothetical protein
MIFSAKTLCLELSRRILTNLPIIIKKKNFSLIFKTKNGEKLVEGSERSQKEQRTSRQEQKRWSRIRGRD